jgi:hypothetical protein
MRSDSVQSHNAPPPLLAFHVEKGTLLNSSQYLYFCQCLGMSTLVAPVVSDIKKWKNLKKNLEKKNKQSKTCN